MDPNATLTHLRAMAQDVLRQIDVDGEGVSTVDVEELASMVQNLDQWIRSGGFLPTDWEKK